MSLLRAPEPSRRRTECEIVDYEKYAIDGIPRPMNDGQFIEINLVSVKPR